MISSAPVRSSRLISVAALVALGASSSGCVIMAHEAGMFGWYDESVRTKHEPKNVVVTSEPMGAEITRKDPGGQEKKLGMTPLADVVDLEIVQKVESPNTGPLWIGATLEFIVGFGLMIAGTVGSVGGEDGINLATFFGLGMTGTFLTTAGMVDGIAAIVHGGKEERVSTSVPNSQYTYAARLEGVPDTELSVRLPDQSNAHLVLARGSVLRKTDARWIVAVMEVEDSNAKNARAIDPTLVRDLGDQMRIFVTQRGVKTVDRGTQEQTLKQQISKMKTESYDTCYDDSCQIELGKALAASHILRTKITRFGDRCVLNGELIDLRTEVTVTAASSQGSCAPEGFLEMGATVARDLVGARP
jgi:hypothetical protein